MQTLYEVSTFEMWSDPVFSIIDVTEVRSMCFGYVVIGKYRFSCIGMPLYRRISQACVPSMYSDSALRIQVGQQPVVMSQRANFMFLLAWVSQNQVCACGFAQRF